MRDLHARLLACVFFGIAAFACIGTSAPRADSGALSQIKPRDIAYEIVARYPHRTGAFTQGLELVGSTLYESSGLYQKSYVARWQLGGNQRPTQTAIAPEFFAEGITVRGDKLYLLTWQSQVGLVLNAHTLAIERRFAYRGEGWGLTHNDRTLIMSDGSNSLRLLDPDTLQTTATLAVTDRGAPVMDLNELEWIDAGAVAQKPRILANIWKTDRIAAIDPESGAVTAFINLHNLYPPRQRRNGDDVLNGIAFDTRDNTLLVTGKQWPWLWRIRLRQPLP